MYADLGKYFDENPHADNSLIDLRDCSYVYHVSTSTGHAKICKVTKLHCGIDISGHPGTFSNDGRLGETKHIQLFRVNENVYNALVTLHGIGRVEPLPTYKSIKEYVCNVLENNKLVLCVTKVTIGKNHHEYGISLIEMYDHDLQLYSSVNGKIYDEVVPIDDQGVPIRVIQF